MEKKIETAVNNFGPPGGWEVGVNLGWQFVRNSPCLQLHTRLEEGWPAALAGRPDFSLAFSLGTNRCLGGNNPGL